MKIDDGALNRYLIKNLQPLTEADPSLLANYVAALLKNNKPKKELQKLCIDQLYDFLGDGTKSFVAKLFQSLEDGTVPLPAEEMEASKALESASGITSGADVIELRTSPTPHPERLPNTALRAFGEGEDDSTDDEDDDRNHKHRRRVSRSRSFDRDGEDDIDRGLYRKRGRALDNNGQMLRENDRQGNERRVGAHLHNEREGLGKFERRMGRDHGGGRFNPDGRGAGRSGPFREGHGPRFDVPNGMMRGSIGRGRGIGLAWGPHDQRFPPPSFPDGPEFAPPLLPPGPGTGFFPGRGIPGRGTGHNPWPGYGPLPGLGNGPLEHSHPLSAGIGGGRGPPPISAGMGMSMNINMGRPRCLDFEERGYCLRGDLCPMEHGANRIVVEDVQSLSKFNLPVSLPSGRSLGGSAPGPTPGPMLPPGLGLVNRTNHSSREPSVPALGEDMVKGVIIPGNSGAEPDSYDPDQPLWNKDRSEAASGLRTLTSFKKRGPDQEWAGDPVEKREDRETSETKETVTGTGTGRLVRIGGNANGGSQPSDGLPSVWDRIGPVVPVGSRFDGGLRTTAAVDLPLGGKQLRKEGGDEAVPRSRVPWQGKWNRGDVEPEDESAPRGPSSTPTARGRGTATGEAGGQRSGEGTSYGSRGTGGRGSSGFGAERAQRTLYVSFIPPANNKTEQLLAHFRKFGEVLDIRIPAHSDRAFVQFSRREDAEAALTAPDAVIGNRFIRLSWANRDSIADPGDTKTLSRAVKPTSEIYKVSALPATKASEKGAGIGTGGVPGETAPVDPAGKSLGANGAPPTTPTAGVAVKKQEELARMREEIRKKQEALARKRVDFRRKLDELAKQGTPGEASEAEQPSKRQKLEDAEESATVSGKTVFQSTPSVTASTVPVELAPTSAAQVSSNPGEGLNKQVVASPTVQPPQPSPRSGKVLHGRMSPIAYGSPMARGPARFKLDNRTTVFRILPPFPPSVTDVAVLKDHFVMFGELSTIEVDDTEGLKSEGSTKLNENTTVRVSFATRRAAERAFVQGRWLQGQNLQLVWVNSPITPTIAGGISVLTRADSLGEKPSLASQKPITASPSTVEQEGINGIRSIDESMGPGQEILVAEGNALGERGGVTGEMDKSPSSTVQILERRRDSGLQGHAVSKSGRGYVNSGSSADSAGDNSLVSESAGNTNLSS